MENEKNNNVKKGESEWWIKIRLKESKKESKKERKRRKEKEKEKEEKNLI